MESESKKSSFKIDDKRQFNPDGSERSEGQPNASSSQSSSSVSHEQIESMNNEEVSLSSFIMSLATQGMMQLGEMQAPEGYQVPVDLAHAKQTIDLISMLKEKTKGNQDQFEAKLFEEVLYSLRMSFVKRKGSA
jgi:hypothetical protein